MAVAITVAVHSHGETPQEDADGTSEMPSCGLRLHLGAQSWEVWGEGRGIGSNKAALVGTWCVGAQSSAGVPLPRLTWSTMGPRGPMARKCTWEL